MTSLTPSLRLALINKAKKQKNLLQKGFTLIELMVVVAIIGVLTAVGLPELTKAQNRADDAAAKAEVVNFGKSCSLALLAGDTVPTATSPVTGTCAAGGSLVGTGAVKKYTVAVDANGIPAKPVEAAK